MNNSFVLIVLSLLLKKLTVQIRARKGRSRGSRCVKERISSSWRLQPPKRQLDAHLTVILRGEHEQQMSSKLQETNLRDQDVDIRRWIRFCAWHVTLRTLSAQIFQHQQKQNLYWNHFLNKSFSKTIVYDRQRVTLTDESAAVLSRDREERKDEQQLPNESPRTATHGTGREQPQLLVLWSWMQQCPHVDKREFTKYSEKKICKKNPTSATLRSFYCKGFTIGPNMWEEKTNEKPQR